MKIGEDQGGGRKLFEFYESFQKSEMKNIIGKMSNLEKGL
jgi:hypothetical protein